MATYSVPSGVSTISETLVASTVDTVTFADRYRYVLINVSAGTTPVFVTTDGSTPALSGNGSGVSVGANEMIVMANGGKSWYQTSNVIPAGSVQYPTGGQGVTATPNGQPGSVQPPMSSGAGHAANPGTVIKLISTGTPSYTISGAG